MKEQIKIVESLIFKQSASDATALRAVLTELKMRLEVEEMVIDYGISYAFIDGKYSSGWLPWLTLPELHAKLTELTKG